MFRLRMRWELEYRECSSSHLDKVGVLSSEKDRKNLPDTALSTQGPTGPRARCHPQHRRCKLSHGGVQIGALSNVSTRRRPGSPSSKARDAPYGKSRSSAPGATLSVTP
eukprot:1288088-Prymnesium_polylepis.3